MNRVKVLHALPECVDNKLILQDIESVSGRLTGEQLKSLEAMVMKDVMRLRSTDNWPPGRTSTD